MEEEEEEGPGKDQGRDAGEMAREPGEGVTGCQGQRVIQERGRGRLSDQGTEGAGDELVGT